MAAVVAEDSRAFRGGGDGGSGVGPLMSVADSRNGSVEGAFCPFAVVVVVMASLGGVGGRDKLGGGGGEAPRAFGRSRILINILVVVIVGFGQKGGQRIRLRTH